jgi:hypothetical protein
MVISVRIKRGSTCTAERYDDNTQPQNNGREGGGSSIIVPACNIGPPSFTCPDLGVASRLKEIDGPAGQATWDGHGLAP